METVTIKDIAKICGCGVSTVSRALNNHPDINPDTKAKIMEVVEQHNFIPNNSARNLKITDSRTIAVLVKGISNPMFMKMIKVMEQGIMKKKYSLFLHHVEEHEDEVDVALELIKEKRLNGIIFLGGQFTHTKEKLDTLTVPFVLSTISFVEDTVCDFSSVSVDDVAESYKMVDYLCKQGHKRIAIITTPEKDMSIGKLRYTGYVKALEDNGIELDKSIRFFMDEQVDYYTMQNGYKVAKTMMESGKDFTAIFCIADTLAIGACKAFIEAGYSVPGDVSIAGFDGIDAADFYNPSITTIRQPVKELAEETVKLLFAVIEGKSEHKHMTYPAELIEAGSTRSI